MENTEDPDEFAEWLNSLTIWELNEIYLEYAKEINRIRNLLLESTRSEEDDEK